MKLWPVLNEYNFWSIGNVIRANIYSDASIYKCFKFGDLELDVLEQLHDVKVVALVDDFGMWNKELLNGRLPTYIFKKIAMMPPPSNDVGAYVHYCMENTMGKILIA